VVLDCIAAVCERRILSWWDRQYINKSHAWYGWWYWAGAAAKISAVWRMEDKLLHWIQHT